MSETIFAKGLLAKRSEKAPDFVICSLSVKKSEFIEFLNQQDGDWVNLKVNRSKKDPNKLYAEVDTWKPNTDAKQDYPTNDVISGGKGTDDLPW